MSNLSSRIRKRLKSTVTAFRSDCTFSPYFGFLRILDELGGRIGLKRISAWVHVRKDRWILDYLKRDLSAILAKYKDNTGCGIPGPDSPVWVCWWTGEESAPPLVKQCIASIRRNAGTHPVHLITQSNYAQYLDIPANVLEVMQSGQVCFANFSDYLRFSLLSRYGGLWLDATIYCAAALSEEIFEMPLFTCKSPERECGYISRYRWTSFCFGGSRNGPLFGFMSDALAAFWIKNGRSIDYLLVDYLIELAYSEIPVVRALLDAVPYNNLNRDDLQTAMNQALPAEALDNVIREDTVLYKLSWRETYAEKNTDGADTIYSRFIHSDPQRFDK